MSGTLKAQWGFDAFEGPTFHLRASRSVDWTLASADQSALIVGRDDTVHLKSDQAVCVDTVSVEDAQGKKLEAKHKLVKPDELQVDIPLKNVSAGQLTMQVKQYGLSTPDSVTLHTYAEAGHLDSFHLDARDRQGMLKGTRLDEVASLELDGVQFAPGGLTRAGSSDELAMIAPDSADLGKLTAGASDTAHVKLKDGRVLDLATTVQASRPKVTLISKSIQQDASANASPIQLQGDDQLPQNATLSFSLKAQVPSAFARNETIEVATADDPFTPY